MPLGSFNETKVILIEKIRIKEKNKKRVNKSYLEK